MGWRSTVVLAVLILVIGAYVWFDQTPQPDPRGMEFGAVPQRAPTTAVQPLLEFRSEDVMSVRLEHAGQIVQAERDGDHWIGAASPGDISDFLRSLGGLGVLAQIPEGAADLKAFGLQPPQRVLQLHLRGVAAPLVLEIGDRNPATTGVYARIGADGPVVLAGALAVWEFDKAFRALGTERGSKAGTSDPVEGSAARAFSARTG